MKDRVIALGGMLQAIKLVQEMANNGQSETRPLATCIDSLFRFDADSTEAVYGSVAELGPGLRRVIAQLDGEGRDPVQTRMAMSVLGLERRFIRNEAVVASLQRALSAVAGQREQLGPTHPAVLSRLGEIYAEHISPLGPRVMVQGNPVYLAQPGVVGEVRAGLLAALRAAVLWRQVGGSYWDFLLSRRRLVEIARDALS